LAKQKYRIRSQQIREFCGIKYAAYLQVYGLMEDMYFFLVFD
jgi:hypothetical protein